MFRSILAIAILFLGYTAQITESQAARRMALLIGINEYEHIPKLEKAIGDVEAMGDKLRSLGFDVTTVKDPDRRTMNIEIGKFTAKLGPGDMAFVHYSGHGVEIDGDNFLLPRDIPKPQDGQKDTVKYEAIGLRRLISQFKQTGARARVFIIDACRDNPFEQSGVRSVGSTRGLTRIVAPAGNFIMYSAGYRQLALDKLGPDDFSKTSVYTRTLLRRLGTPGMSIADIARDVRNEVQTVARGIGHVQRPAYYDELSSSLVLVPETAKPLVKEKTKTPEVAALGNFPVNNLQSTSDKQIELLYWNEVKDLNSVAALQSYLAQYPSGSFAPLANIRIKALLRAETEKKQAQADEATKLAEQQQEKQQHEKTASLADPIEDETDDQPELRGRELALRVQEELNRLGCSVGRPDGAWGRGSRRGLSRYISRSDSDIVSLRPNMLLLEELELIDERICSRVVKPKREKKKQQARERRKTKKQQARERRKREKTKKSASQRRKERARRAAERKRKRARTKQARVVKKKRKSNRTRVLVRQGNRAASPKRRKRVCADRERSLCNHDN
ncbi:MAG: caspase family protein [Alphaproteobacteria bacterium]|nr:caspase family protein [Alphaproteobacteria bacterium]